MMDDLTKGSHFMMEEKRIVESVFPDGVDAKMKKEGDILYVDMEVSKSQEDPIFMCFVGYTPGLDQRIRIRLRMKKGVKATMLSRCIFPNDVEVLHEMITEVELEEGSQLFVKEEHYHGENAQTHIVTKSHVVLGPRSTYGSDFRSIKGRMGRIDLDYKTELYEEAKADLSVHIWAKYSDVINSNEEAVLKGQGASAFLKSRMVAADKSSVNVYNTVVAEANHTKGHIECKEITMGEAIASTVPKLVNKTPKAELTHEAYVGQLSKDKLYPLMAKGLSEEQAISFLLTRLLND